MECYRELFETLSREELEALAVAYSDYVMQIVEDECRPVCLGEFYEYDWQDYFKERYMGDKKWID